MCQRELLLPDERLDRVNENISLIQKRNGLTYGTDAFLLASFVRPQPRARAVDLGSGTGIIALLLLTAGKAKTVHAVEIQPAFVDLISRNALQNGLHEKILPLCADVRNLSPAMLGGEVDLVVANPPYMTCNTGKRNLHDEKYLARHEVCGNVGDFCSAAGKILRFGGRFVCVFRPDRLSALIKGLHHAGLEPKRMVFVHADENSAPSSVLVEAVKGASIGLRILPPLLLHELPHPGEQNRVLTPRAAQIYKTCLFEAIK